MKLPSIWGYCVTWFRIDCTDFALIAYCQFEFRANWCNEFDANRKLNNISDEIQSIFFLLNSLFKSSTNEFLTYDEMSLANRLVTVNDESEPIRRWDQFSTHRNKGKYLHSNASIYSTRRQNYLDSIARLSLEIRSTASFPRTIRFQNQI